MDTINNINEFDDYNPYSFKREKGEFASKITLEAFKAKAAKNGWITTEEQKAVEKLYSLSENISFSNLDDALTTIYESNFALNSREKMHYVESILNPLLFNIMLKEQKSITEEEAHDILYGISYMEQKSFDEEYKNIFKEERPKTLKEQEKDAEKAKYYSGMIWADDLTKDEFHEMAAKNGWADFKDYAFLDALFDYRSHNKWNDNRNIDKILNTVIINDVWSVIDREEILNDIQNELNEAKNSGLFPKEYMDNLTSLHNEQRKVSQKDLDNTYQEMFEKERPKTAKDLEFEAVKAAELKALEEARLAEERRIQEEAEKARVEAEKKRAEEERARAEAEKAQAHKNFTQMKKDVISGLEEANKSKKRNAFDTNSRRGLKDDDIDKKFQKVMANSTLESRIIKEEMDALSNSYSKAYDLNEFFDYWRNSEYQEWATRHDIIQTYANVAKDEDYARSYLNAYEDLTKTLYIKDISQHELLGAVTRLYNEANEIIKKTDNSLGTFPSALREDAIRVTSDVQYLFMDFSSIKQWIKDTGIKAEGKSDIYNESYSGMKKTLENINKENKIEKKEIITDFDEFKKNLTRNTNGLILLHKGLREKLGVDYNLTNAEGAKNYYKLGPKPTVEEAAKHYEITKHLEWASSFDSAVKNSGSRNFEAFENGVIDDYINDQVKNPVFKAVFKANPTTYYEKMLDIEKTALEMKHEYQNELAKLDGKYFQYIVYGSAFYNDNTIKTEADREIDFDMKTQRLSQVVLSRILTDPKNEYLLQGIAAGQYDVFEMKEKIFDYIQTKNDFGLKGGDATQFILLANPGNDIEKTIMKDVIKKIKPAKLQKEEPAANKEPVKKAANHKPAAIRK